MVQFFSNGSSLNNGGMNFPGQNQVLPQGSSQSASVRSNSFQNGGNNINVNMLAGLLQNQRGPQQGQSMNMMGQMGQLLQSQSSQQPNQHHHQAQMNFMNQNQNMNMFPPQMANINRRGSDVSTRSQNSVSNHNSNTAQTMLGMHDANGNDRNHQLSQQQINNAPGPSSQTQGQSQHQQEQLLKAMHQRIEQQTQMQSPIQRPASQTTQPQMQKQQSHNSNMSMQASLAQMQRNLAQLQGPPTPQLLAQRQSQIQDFLSRHGHNLSEDQRINLKQQVGGPPGTFDALLNAALNKMNDGGGGSVNNNSRAASAAPQSTGAAQSVGTSQQSMGTSHQSMGPALQSIGVPQPMGMDMNVMQQMQQMLGNNSNAQRDLLPSMSDLMSRQREQLRSLQVMLKTDDAPHGEAGNGQGGTPGPGGNAMDLQMQQHQRQSQQIHPMPVQSQQQQMQQLQQMMHQQQQNQQPQQRVSSAVMEHMIRQRQGQRQGELTEPLQRKRSQEKQSNGQNKMPKTSMQSQLSPPLPPEEQSSSISAAAITTANTTRVIPVVLSPCNSQEVRYGDISEAALIYTKHALNSIVSSLNFTSKGERVYSVRDLSTCLGAWDLSHPSCASNRQKQDSSSSNVNNGDADTAFNFYYERSCPILLDAKRQTGSIPFSVEDFGDDGPPAEGLPALTGAVVLTFGADQKFTGGIGEEGVLTKASFEFFCEPSVALKKEMDGKDPEMDLLIEAEEQMFARVDNGHSSFVMAALHALSPSLVQEGETLADKKVYIPTIWSGNTHRAYQFCLLGNFDDEGKELESKRLCVAIQKKAPSACEDGPAKGVCRITVTLSPASVLAEKKKMANAYEGQNLNEFSSTIHRKIRQNLRCMRPPKLVSPSGLDSNMMGPKRRRVNLRRPSITHLIDPSLIVTGMRCNHQLLLDADEIGKIYVNGSLVVDCSQPNSSFVDGNSKSTILSDSGTLSSDILPAHTLFGIDFTFPERNDSMFFRDLPNKDMLEQEYGALLADALIDATTFELDVAGKLLSRLLSGKIEDADDNDEEEKLNKKGHSRSSSKSDLYDDISFDNVSEHCIESIVLSKSATDPVGIGAKALGTKFRMLYGKEYFPCEEGTDDERRLCKVLGPLKIPKSVPHRLRGILCRGGYLPLDKMAAFIWKGSGKSWNGDHHDSMRASEAMESAIQLLQQAGCNDVKPNMIRFVGRKQLELADASVSYLRCWYDSSSATYYINDSILFAEFSDTRIEGYDTTCIEDYDNQSVKSPKAQFLATEESDKPKSEVPHDEETPVTNEDTSSKTVLDHRRELNADKCNSKDTSAAAAAEVSQEPEDKNDGPKNLHDAAESSDKQTHKHDTANETNDAGENDHVKSIEKDQASLASSETTHKVSNYHNEEETKTKRCYRPAKEAAYVLAFSIAREHPSALLLEKFVICHST
eukprot:scaffold249348_cov72-Cyclotella_meneghiniana.AAC.6